ncbi:MAG TPA: T9SS type A sorting domain-containing protein [Bacteroidia bacterium]|nr:T9SS type A sorting domain-containing protein [Bacteroidia bacterium]MBP7715049.1 T9SS type A sorting domain-containing protein [Bacteroidia bacterium]HOZ83506.1 T9SS type A sorting domain-containing protein [Bacteroidia bacterium]HQW18445.1 T9SS type A sorting domain-containing protein [Bacteroidia bacterium]HQW49849.1 T9SS type A sorting domain-containing protein [Bacteroidia bacterium]
MKKLLLLLLIGLTVKCAAQDYAGVRVGDTAHYYHQTNYYFPLGKLKAIAIDSVAVNANETELFNTFLIHGQDPLCIKYDRENWTGKKITRTINGIEKYITGNNDTIVVDPITQVGSSWVFCNLANNTHFDATVLSVQPESFLNISDSVISFSLQLKDNSSQNIAHPFNGKTLKLSKQYGWIHTINFLDFPTDTALLTITGTTQSNLGYQNLIADSIFNFNIGDTFQYHDYGQSAINQWDEYFLSLTILTKNISTNGDTLLYTADRQTYNRNFSAPNLLVNYTHDTTTLIYPLSNYSYLNKLEEKIDSANFAIKGVFVDSRQTCGNNIWTKAVFTCLYNLSDSCLGILIDCTNTFNYANGLGMVSFDASTFYPVYTELIFYSKNGVSCGTPINFNQLLSVNEINKESFTLLNNPTNGILRIQTTIPESIITIREPSGKEIWHKTIKNTGLVELPLNVANGIYLLTVENQNNRTTKKLIVNNY